jgi:uncharacterized protein with PIN domain
VTVFDAQAVVAFLVGEPAASEVERRLRDPGDRSLVCAASIAEVVDVTTRLMAVETESVTQRLDWLAAGGLTTLDVDDGIGRRAGELRARHYERRTRPISLGDCLALASAIREREPFASSDPALIATARDEGVDVVPLPDSRGDLPTV